MVCDGLSAGAIFGATVGCALELDRILGYESDSAGTSFLAPPQDILGAPLFAPALDVVAGRPAPTYAAVQWDDDGVAPREYPVISGGCVVDFYTSRKTAPALDAWYRSRGITPQSRGCAVAVEADRPVSVRPPHQAIRPASSTASAEDLCKDVQHGVFLREDAWISADQQLTSGSVHSQMMFEIDRGRIVARLARNGLEFSTRTLWKSLTTLGDRTTVRTCNAYLHKGQPWAHAAQSTSAPAASFFGVNVVSTGRGR
jgi:TldD protein